MEHIYLIGLNHKTAPVEIRERFALEKKSNRDFKSPQVKGVKEVMLLSTCNRVEILCVGGEDPSLFKRLLQRWAEVCAHPDRVLQSHIYSYRDAQAVTHLFEVASSLDSMVVGEPQILGQIKEAYRRAVDEGTTGAILNRLLHRAFSVAKRIRSETRIAQSAVSVSYAAVELARHIFSDLTSKRAMLIGAGEMAELAARHLVNAGIKRLIIVNRTVERARDLARALEGEAYPFSQLFSILPSVDIIISSTGSTRPIIHKRDVQKILRSRKYTPMFFIDIAVPRDIDPDVNTLDNVYLYDIDDLKDIVQENLEKRSQEAKVAHRIIEEEVDAFYRWMKSLEVTPTIKELLSRWEEMGEKEIHRTLKKLGPDIPPSLEEELHLLVESLIKKIAHYPITFLKKKSREEEQLKTYISLIRRIFKLDKQDLPPHIR